jgi:hypothetical protein
VARESHVQIESPARGGTWQRWQTLFLHNIFDFEQHNPYNFSHVQKEPQQVFGVLLKQKETPKRTLKWKKEIVRTRNRGLKEAPRKQWL